MRSKFYLLDICHKNDSFKDETLICLQLVWKLLIMNFMSRSVEVISYMYVGRLGEIYLSSAGLANVTSNVTGNSILMGLGGALSTLASQAHGAGDENLLSELLQRAVMILTIVCIPISISWIFSSKIIEFLGQDHEIAHLSSSYLMFLVPGLFSKAYSICLEGWLTSQQETEGPAVISICTAILHPLWCYFFIFSMNFHYLGSAAAISFTRFLEALFLTINVAYVIVKQKKTFLFTRRAFTKWGSYLAIGVPNVLMTSQW